MHCALNVYGWPCVYSYHRYMVCILLGGLLAPSYIFIV